MMSAPGPRYPPLAQTIHYFLRPESFITGLQRRYGDVFAIETVIFGKEVGVVRPDAVKAVFTGDPEELRAGEANVALEPVLGKHSVLLLDGSEHLRQRRLVLPPFHGERMLAYADTMRDVTRARVDAWPRGKPFAIHPELQAITLEVILRTVFGADEGAELDALRGGIASFLEIATGPLTMLSSVPPFRRDLGGLSPWARFTRRRAQVDALVYAQIARRRSAGSAGRTDILSLLLDARDDQGEAMTDVELRDELMTLLVAGHETTATELAWAFDLVLRDARVLRRIEDEQAASGGDLSRMPYLDATIKEVLRLRPVVPAVARKLQRPMRIGDVEIPAGTLVVPSSWLAHRQPDLYPNPGAFEPERFLDKKPDPYAWFPFGGGIRRCIGMAFALFEMRVVLATVLTRARLRAVTKRPARVVLRAFTHAPEKGVPVVVTEA
jgi:cytochrome P450